MNAAVLPILLLAFLLAGLGSVALRSRPKAARALYRTALLLAVVPYLLHVRYTWGWVSGWGDPQPPIGVYPGLVAFAVAGTFTAVALAAAAWVLAVRVPLVTVALPAALWLLYWFGILRLVTWRGPDFVPLDNKPLIGLFLFSAFATVLLALSAWAALAHSDASHP